MRRPVHWPRRQEPSGRRHRGSPRTCLDGRWSYLLLAWVSTWAVGGCTGRPTRAHAAAPVAVEQPPAREPPSRTPVPDLPLTLQDGFPLRLPMMKGKLIAVFFCAAYDDAQCQREADGLGAHHAELRDAHHVVIIGVSPATPAAHEAFLSARRSPLDFASDADGRIGRAFGMAGARDALPMVVVARDGTIRAVWHGVDPERHVRDLIAAAAD